MLCMVESMEDLEEILIDRFGDIDVMEFYAPYITHIFAEVDEDKIHYPARDLYFIGNGSYKEVYELGEEYVIKFSNWSDCQNEYKVQKELEKSGLKWLMPKTHFIKLPEIYYVYRASEIGEYPISESELRKDSLIGEEFNYDSDDESLIKCDCLIVQEKVITAYSYNKEPINMTYKQIKNKIGTKKAELFFNTFYESTFEWFERLIEWSVGIEEKTFEAITLFFSYYEIIDLTLHNTGYAEDGRPVILDFIYIGENNEKIN